MRWFGVSTYLPATFGSPGADFTALDVVQTTVITQHAFYAIEPAGTYAPSVAITSELWDAVIAGFTISP